MRHEPAPMDTLGMGLSDSWLTYGVLATSIRKRLEVTRFEFEIPHGMCRESEHQVLPTPEEQRRPAHHHEVSPPSLQPAAPIRKDPIEPPSRPEPKNKTQHVASFGKTPNEHTLQNPHLQQLLESSALSGTEGYILRRLYGLPTGSLGRPKQPASAKQIATELGLSRQAVGELEQQALIKLQQKIQSGELPEEAKEYQKTPTIAELTEPEALTIEADNEEVIDDPDDIEPLQAPPDDGGFEMSTASVEIDGQLPDATPHYSKNVLSIEAFELASVPAARMRLPLLKASEEVQLSREIEAGLVATEVLSKLEGYEILPESVPYISSDMLQRYSTLEELRADLTAVSAKGEQAKTQFIRSNIGIVKVITSKQRGLRHMEYDDVEQEGYIGLVKAVERFDYKQGNKFSTYAVWWIRQAISRGTAWGNNIIDVPVNVYQQLGGLYGSKSRLTKELNRSPTDDELAVDMNVELKLVKKLQALDKRLNLLNLDQTLDTGGGSDATTFGEIIADPLAPAVDEVAVENVERERIQRLVAMLDHPYRRVLECRFGFDGSEPKTYDKLSEELGVARATVKSYETRAMMMVRKLLQQ